MKKILALGLVILSIATTLSAQTKAKKVIRPAQAMPDMYIDGLLAAMKNQRGDEAKLAVIQNGIKNNTDGITVAQELRLMPQFATDDSKLQCAMFLYPWCVDFQNYAKVQYTMGDAAKQKTLTDYIKKQGGK
jgi:hypothetical protein